LAGPVAHVGEMRNVHILIGKPEGMRPLGRSRRRWEDDGRMRLRERGKERCGLDGI
jgi:hypothetical protein